MILGAIAEAGGALLVISCFMVCVELFSLILRFVLSVTLLLLFVLVLSVSTFESDVD